MIDAGTRRLVWNRAGGCCEYCRLQQYEEPVFSLHIEHLIPRQHLGSDHESNLALACHYCNNHKGPNLAAIDPQSGQMVELFQPRKHNWHDHFRFAGAVITGASPVGRATVQLLRMNDQNRVDLRSVVH
jgi:hypothetical protein